MAMIRFQIVPATIRDNGITIGAGYAWRFMTANNRDEARSPRVYPTIADAETAIAGLKARLGEIRVDTRPGLPGTYEWRASIGGEPVALCARRYDRPIRARTMGESFLAEARRAAISVADPGKFASPLVIRA